MRMAAAHVDETVVDGEELDERIMAVRLDEPNRDDAAVVETHRGELEPGERGLERVEERAGTAERNVED